MRSSPVAVLRTVTVAPGTTAPGRVLHGAGQAGARLGVRAGVNEQGEGERQSEDFLHSGRPF